MLNNIRSMLLIMKYGSCWDAKKFDKAIDALLQARQLTPESQEILTFLAGAYLQTERNDEAKDVLIEALKSNPNDYHLNQMMATVLYNLKEFESMIPYIKAALNNKTQANIELPGYAGFIEKLKEQFKEQEIYHKDWESWARKVLLFHESQ